MIEVKSSSCRPEVLDEPPSPHPPSTAGSTSASHSSAEVAAVAPQRAVITNMHSLFFFLLPPKTCIKHSAASAAQSKHKN